LDLFEQSLVIEREEHLAIGVIDQLRKLAFLVVTQFDEVVVAVGDAGQPSFFVEVLDAAVVEVALITVLKLSDVLVAEVIGMKLRPRRERARLQLAELNVMFPLLVAEKSVIGELALVLIELSRIAHGARGASGLRDLIDRILKLLGVERDRVETVLGSA